MESATASAPARTELRQECLSFTEILAQSVANIAPTATPVMNLALVFASAGQGTWLAYLLATVGLILVGININQFAKRSATPGSMYVYISKGLGPTSGFISGWCLIFAYVFTAIAVLAGLSNYAVVVFQLLGIVLPPSVPIILFAIIVWFFAYKDVQLSTRMMLLLEISSMCLLLVLGVVVLMHKHAFIDAGQLTLKGMTFDNLKAGLILAVFSYVGYESATALGSEAKNPKKFIPRAVILSALISGLFFMFCSYFAILGFQGISSPLEKSSAPMNDLAISVGLPFLGVITSICAIVSFFACALACVNAAARVLFTMGRHNIFHASLGNAHATNETPHHSVTTCSIIMLAVCVAMQFGGIGVMDIYNYTGTLATFGFLVVYLLISIAAPVYLYTIKALKPWNIVVSLLSIAFVALPIIGSVVPLPDPPMDKLPFYFLGFLVVGILWFVWVRSRNADVLGSMKNYLSELYSKEEVTGPGKVEEAV
jgi:amino acid transporter